MFELEEPVGDAELEHHCMGSLQVDGCPADIIFALFFFYRVHVAFILYIGENFGKSQVPTEV